MKQLMPSFFHIAEQNKSDFFVFINAKIATTTVSLAATVLMEINSKPGYL